MRLLSHISITRSKLFIVLLMAILVGLVGYFFVTTGSNLRAINAKWQRVDRILKEYDDANMNGRHDRVCNLPSGTFIVFEYNFERKFVRFDGCTSFDELKLARCNVCQDTIKISGLLLAGMILKPENFVRPDDPRYPDIQKQFPQNP